MPSLTEKIELLGKGLYEKIPDELTLRGIPTVSELEYVSSEDFDATMLDKILPEAIEEKINPRDLLEIDYNWVCRCLRFLNYGPYYTTNAIWCGHCGKTHYGEYTVDLRSINTLPLPKAFINSMTIKRDEFLDFNGDVTFKLPTIQQKLNWEKDNAFKRADGSINRELARICYVIKSLGSYTNMTPFEYKAVIEKEFSPADYVVLKNKVIEMSNYGLRAAGTAQCPVCGEKDASFLALTTERFFRPTLGDLHAWKRDRSKRADENTAGDKTAAV